MAWRPIRYLVEGEIDNTLPGKVTGWLQFARMKDKVILDLADDFHRDIRGTRIHLSGDGCRERTGYLYGFSPSQTGKVGDMTAGYPPRDCRSGLWFEWYTGGIQAVLVVRGDVEIATDLAAARLEAVDPERGHAYLVLPAPAVVRPRIDHERTRIYKIDRSGLWQMIPGEAGERDLVNKAL